MATYNTRKKKLARQKELRQKNGNAWTKKYEKTKKGFLVRKYRNMQSRVTGVQKLKAHLYQGLAILPREEFYKWAMADQNFHKLFQTWEGSGYDRKLCPSVNRIDSQRGYELNNIEWITHSENSILGNYSKKKI